MWLINLANSLIPENGGLVVFNSAVYIIIPFCIYLLYAIVTCGSGVGLKDMQEQVNNNALNAQIFNKFGCNSNTFLAEQSQAKKAWGSSYNDEKFYKYLYSKYKR